MQRSNRTMKAVHHDICCLNLGERRNLHCKHPYIAADLKKRFAAWETMDAEEKQVLVRVW